MGQQVPYICGARGGQRPEFSLAAIDCTNILKKKPQCVWANSLSLLRYAWLPEPWSAKVAKNGVRWLTLTLLIIESSTLADMTLLISQSKALFTAHLFCRSHFCRKLDPNKDIDCLVQKIGFLRFADFWQSRSERYPNLISWKVWMLILKPHYVLENAPCMI